MSEEVLMTPEEFGAALDDLIVAVGLLAVLPLERMTEYVDVVERLGEHPDNAGVWTTERCEAAAHAGRIIAAAAGMRTAAAMGGAS